MVNKIGVSKFFAILLKQEHLKMLVRIAGCRIEQPVALI